MLWAPRAPLRAWLRNSFADRIYKELHHFKLDGIRFNNVTRHRNTICATLQHGRSPCRLSYMQPGLRGFSSELAVHLRGIAGRNVYFDIVHGELTLHI